MPEPKKPAPLKHIYNCHTHVFTNRHVPDHYLSVPYLVRILDLPGIRHVLYWLLNRINPFSRYDFFNRLTAMVRISRHRKQSDIFEILRSSYPPESRFVLLAMDMAYMYAGAPREKYEQQLNDLSDIKQAYPDTVFPFICVDPRRDGIEKMVRNYIEKRGFQGIKLYPALGYFPFPLDSKKARSHEERLGELYAYAEKNQIPVMTHTSTGGVYGRRRIYSHHPITDEELRGWKMVRYGNNFTDPGNYRYALQKYPKLKLCLGHFGGQDEWRRFLTQPVTSPPKRQPEVARALKATPLENPFWNPTSGRVVERPWVIKVMDLLKDKDESYPNLYTDISFTSSDPALHPFLKVLLEDKDIASHVLFGTDFYVVALKSTERQFSIGLRGFLGEDKYQLIAETNAKKYLSSKIHPVS